MNKSDLLLTAMDERNRNEVRVVIKSYEILEVISKESLIGISEIARKSGLKITTVARLLATLKKIGLVDQDESTQKYFLTMHLVDLADRVLENFDLRSLSRPFIEKFVKDYGRTVLFSVIKQDQIIYIDSVRGIESFRIGHSLGDEVLAHCTADGKAILANLPLEKRRLLVGKEPFRSFTANTITDWTTLDEELNTVRKNGFAIDFYERFEEIVAVAVPVFNYKGRVIGAVSTPRIVTSIDQAALEEWGRQLVELGRNISIRLGWIEA